MRSLQSIVETSALFWASTLLAAMFIAWVVL